MGQYFYFLIAAFLAALFMFFMVFTKGDNNQKYILFVLLAFPFISIDIFPSAFATGVFDMLTLGFVCFFYKRKQGRPAHGKLYLLAFLILTGVIIAGTFQTESISNTVVAITRYITAFTFAKILIDECLNDKKFISSISKAVSIILAFSFLFLSCQLI